MATLNPAHEHPSASTARRARSRRHWMPAGRFAALGLSLLSEHAGRDAQRSESVVGWAPEPCIVKEEILSTFDEQLASLHRIGTDLARSLSEQIAAEGLQVQFVSWRLKDRASLARKLARPERTYKTLWDVTDLVGIRIATYFEDTIEDIARLVESRLRIDLRHSTDKLRFKDSGRFGYRSLHYVCAVPSEQTPHPDFRLEIQIRTLLQHAWAEIEHDLGYKSQDAVPEPIRRRFNRIASLLEIADQEFVSIRRDLLDYQAEVRAELLQGQSLPLDTVSLDSFTSTDEVHALDRQVAEFLGRPCVDEPFFPSYLVRALTLTDLHTTDAVRKAVILHGPQLGSFLRSYFAFAETTLGLSAASLESVQRGYSLLFIAHLVIVRGAERSLSKVSRLTRLYAELDYSGDEARAHDVASKELGSVS